MEQGVVTRRATRSGRRRSPTLEPRQRAASQLGAWILLPVLLGLLSHALAWTLPADRVWTNAAQAVLLTAPRYLLLAWVAGALVLLLRARLVLWPLLMATAGLTLAGIPTTGAEGEGLLLISTNVQAYAETRAPLEQALAALEPDVVIAIEQRAEAIDGLVRMADNYDRDLVRPSHGTAVFCRAELGCDAEITQEFGSPTSHMPLALVRVQGLCILGVHGPPPVPLDASGLAPYMARIADAISGGRLVERWGPCAIADPVLIAGDLNAVPGSGPHRLLRSRGLVDAVQDQGIWAGTWPAGGGWPDLPLLRLDHLLAGPLEVSSVRTLRLPGADHKALRARVRPAVMLADREEAP